MEINITDCQVRDWVVEGMRFRAALIITPASTNPGDVLDVSSLFEKFCFASCFGQQDKTLMIEDSILQITIPGASMESKTIMAFGE